MAGPYETLMQALAASSYMSGINLYFGEEMIAAQDTKLPCIVAVPRGGIVNELGFVEDGSVSPPQDIDFFTEDLWTVSELFQFYCRGQSTDPNRQQALHHTEATRAIRLSLLSALNNQRDMLDSDGNSFKGLAFKVLRSDWQRVSDIVGRDDNQFARAIDRFGRALVMSVQIEIPEVQDSIAQNGEQQVESTEFDMSVTNQAG